jgi:acyl-CoA thioester hydrolase
VDGYRFSTEVPVRFAETDAQGIVHHSVYVVWFEIARIEYLARYAGGYQSIRDQGYEVVVLEAHANYHKPARFGDTVRIHVRAGDARGVRFRYEYVIARDDETLVDGWTSHAFVDARTVTAVRIPEFVADAIDAAEGRSSSS